MAGQADAIQKCPAGGAAGGAKAAGQRPAEFPGGPGARIWWNCRATPGISACGAASCSRHAATGAGRNPPNARRANAGAARPRDLDGLERLLAALCRRVRRPCALSFRPALQDSRPGGDCSTNGWRARRPSRRDLAGPAAPRSAPRPQNHACAIGLRRTLVLLPVHQGHEKGDALAASTGNSPGPV